MSQAPRSASLGTAAFQAAEAVDGAAGAFALQNQAAQPRTKSRAVTGPPRWLGWVYGVFLVYNVARMQEVFPSFDIPRLPLILAGFIMAIVFFNTSPKAWITFWQSSQIFRTLVGILVLAIVTIPIGIWASGSFWFFRTRYIVQWLSFAIGMVLFCDRVMLRRTLTILILGVSAAAYQALRGKAATVGADVARVQIAGSLDPNDFAAILVTLVPLALWLGHRGGFRRFWWTSIAILLFAGVIPTASRGGLLGICAVALVLILQGTSGARRVMLASLVGGGALLFSVVVSDAQLARFTGITGDTYNTSSGDGRMAIWKRGVWWTIKRPTGYGLGNFPIYFAWLNGPERSAHNSLVQIGMELGALALALYLFVHLSAIRGGRRLRTAAIAARERGVPGADDEAALIGYSLAALAGLFVTGFFLANAYRGLTMMVFSILAATQLGDRFAHRNGQALKQQPAARGGRQAFAEVTRTAARNPSARAQGARAFQRGYSRSPR